MNRKKRQWIICIAVLIFCVTGCEKAQNVQIYEETEQVWEIETGSEESRETAASGKIYVDVCGAVKKPQVIEVPEGSRVFEVIEKAGGVREDAWVQGLNQAAVVTDGQQIRVPTFEEEKNWENTQTQSGAEQPGKINLNEANAEELMSLPGIGQAKAADIIEYRETIGRFQSIEEIKNISGIKDAVFEKIKEKIVV